MVRLNDILEEMAGKLNCVTAVSVVGMDGLTVAEYNPANVNFDAFSALFANSIKTVERSIRDLEEWGELEGTLILLKTDKAWILTHLLNNWFFLAIAVGRKEDLRNVRMVASQYADQLLRRLSPA